MRSGFILSAFRQAHIPRAAASGKTASNAARVPHW